MKNNYPLCLIGKKVRHQVTLVLKIRIINLELKRSIQLVCCNNCSDNNLSDTSTSVGFTDCKNSN